MAKPKDAGAGVIEREDICGRFIRTSASGADGRPRPRVATCAAAGAHPYWEPHAVRCVGFVFLLDCAFLNGPGAVGTQTPPTTPEPRVEQVPHRVAEHVETVKR